MTAETMLLLMGLGSGLTGLTAGLIIGFQSGVRHLRITCVDCGEPVHDDLAEVDR